MPSRFSISDRSSSWKRSDTDVDDEQYFNQVWAALYDWADTDHQLWLNVWPAFSRSAS